MEIEGYPNYLIYPDGRVWSKKRNIFLKPASDKDGYYKVSLYNNGKCKTFRLHRLIALHYIPLVEGKDIIDHKNNIRTDNRVENLHWVNVSENRMNTPVHCNNKLGIKNINLTKCDTYRVHIRRNKKRVYSKTFKTLDMAIIARDEYINNEKII